MQDLSRNCAWPPEACFKTAWSHILTRAVIVGFRWHDLRHHFASRLMQTGVPLNTVRDLLGHASVAMSLRYAHLAPDQRCEAVARLDDKPSTPQADTYTLARYDTRIIHTSRPPEHAAMGSRLR